MKLLPRAASSLASEVDAITLALTGLSIFIVALIATLVLVFVVRYRRRAGHEAEPTRTYLWLELSWTGIPLVISLGIFGWAAVVYYKQHQAPADATEIYVVGKQWMWKFQHANGRQELNTLHVPAGKPIRLIMTSQDVVHSLFVPEFRVKQDVLPGRYAETWFEATEPGEYHLFCTQYCGTSHAKMRGTVIVMPPAEFARWLAAGAGQEGAAQPGLASLGGRLFTQLGCISCHGQGATVRAPDLAGLYGRRVGLRTGATVLADENYLRESILRPNAKIAQGYEPIMPSYQGQVSEEQLAGLIAYLKTLKHNRGTSQ